MARNILNHAEVMLFCEHKGLNRPAHIATWLTSIFYKWVTQVAPVTKPVIDRRQLNNPLVMILGEIVNSHNPVVGLDGTFASQILSRFHAVDLKQHEPWLSEALARFDLVEWVDLSKLDTTYQVDHWLDFMSTLPERQIRYAVPDMEAAVAAWDKQLAKQKLISSMGEGIEVLAELPETEGHTLVLVKLVTEMAYHNEGAAMSHCVGRAGYFHRDGVEIWSLRSPQSEWPLATIEVQSLYGKERRLAQVRGKHNSVPPTWVTDRINEYATSQGIHLQGWYGEIHTEGIEREEPLPEAVAEENIDVDIYYQKLAKKRKSAKAKKTSELHEYEDIAKALERMEADQNDEEA